MSATHRARTDETVGGGRHIHSTSSGTAQVSPQEMGVLDWPSVQWRRTLFSSAVGSTRSRTESPGRTLSSWRPIEPNAQQIPADDCRSSTDSVREDILDGHHTITSSAIAPPLQPFVGPSASTPTPTTGFNAHTNPGEGIKGAGGLGEPRGSKHCRPKAEARSEPRESSPPGAFGV